MKTKTKICGLTREEDVSLAVQLGYSAIGLNFFESSPRYLSVEQATKLSQLIPSSVLSVGVFVNAEEAYVRERIEACNLNAVQFHGDESIEFCELFKEVITIKGVRLKPGVDISPFSKLEYLLVDAYDESEFGGTGQLIPESLLAAYQFETSRMILAGGLRADNVLAKLQKWNPAWVDVASGVESEPGIKCHKKMKDFIDAVQGI